jgi:hypothetical protein
MAFGTDEATHHTSFFPLEIAFFLSQAETQQQHTIHCNNTTPWVVSRKFPLRIAFGSRAHIPNRDTNVKYVESVAGVHWRVSSRIDIRQLHSGGRCGQRLSCFGWQKRMTHL